LDAKTGTKERGGKKISCLTFFVAKNFTKLKKKIIFEMLKKKFGPLFNEIKNFYPKNCR
jgi:hypothetical protein